MDKIKKYYPQLIGLGLGIAFLSTRLYNINGIPIFTDEAIYVHWVLIFRSNIHQLFISLTDGKQPLFVWLGDAIAQVEQHNPLLAVRLVSVCAGLFTMIGLYFLSKELLKDTDHVFLEPTLKFVPYLLMDVKYIRTQDKTGEGVILWGLVDGEMVINTGTWEKTHGFTDCIA